MNAINLLGRFDSMNRTSAHAIERVNSAALNLLREAVSTGKLAEVDLGALVRQEGELMAAAGVESWPDYRGISRRGMSPGLDRRLRLVVFVAVMTARALAELSEQVEVIEQTWLRGDGRSWGVLKGGVTVGIIDEMRSGRPFRSSGPGARCDAPGYFTVELDSGARCFFDTIKDAAAWATANA